MKAAVRRFILTGEGDPRALALALYRWQRAHNPRYAALAGDAEPERIEAIPAVPVSLFKELDLACFDLARPHVTFRTSGTTGQRRGVHHLLDTTLYDLGAGRHFAARVPGAPRRVVSLCPPGGGDSSLGHMVDRFGESVFHGFVEGEVRGETWAALSRGPVLLAATAFALDALFALPGGARLGPESVVMVTGGFKGRRVRLDADGLYAAIPARLGAPRVVGEYGMTELSSQLWTDPVPAGARPGAFVAPPWLLPYAVDPASGLPVAGEGVLRFVDLANVDSVLAIETLDVGAVEGDRVTLLGRLEGAELRGCSLRAEDLLLAARG